MIRFIVIFLLPILCLSCGEPALTKPEKGSFYYWQTTWQWSAKEEAYSRGLAIEELYVRFFDIDWDEHERVAMPVSPLMMGAKHTPLPAHIAVVPTVFITNRTMRNLPDAQVADLAGKVWEKIQIQARAIFTDNPLKMIQLDCDWSGETREKYFNFCKALRARILPALLSATIRLHQVKYAPQTGIPPIDKGVLMCYNVGNINGSNTTNSILDIDILQKYSKAIENYPLPLDIALPAFSWGVLQRRGIVIKLLPEVVEADLDKDKGQMQDRQTWEVQKAHYLGGSYLYEGDKIRIEKTTPNLLEKALKEILLQKRGKKFTLIYYHLHKNLDKLFSVEDLKKPLK
jgi:hypothetical protein